MKKLKSSLINMVVVLTLITIVAGAALAFVNHATSAQIEKIKAENLATGIKQVMVVDRNADRHYRTEGARHFTHVQPELGTASHRTSNGFGGALKVLVGFDNEGTVLGYTILEHAETPGLGAKATEWFQKGQKGDITGKNPGTANFTVSKDGGDIDAITASTITSRAFLLAVQNAYDELIKQQGGTDATTSATEKGGTNNE